jgi:VWFA-related protein
VHRIAWSLAAALLTAPLVLAQQAPPRRVTAPPPSAARAFAFGEDLLADPDADRGTLAIDPRLAPGEAGDASSHRRVVVEVIVPLDRAAPLTGPLRVTLLAATLEGDLVSSQKTVEDPGDLASADAWVYRDALEVDDELHAAVAVVEDLGSGRWGGAPARFEVTPYAASPDTTVLLHDALAPGGATPPAPAAPPAPGTAPSPEATRPPGAPAAGTASAATATARVVAVLPPRERPATGRTRIQTLVTTELVSSVDFFLDGEPAGTDERPPFSATLDLGAEARPHTIRAVARDRSGTVLGEHTLEINGASATRFAVAITALAPRPGRAGGGAPATEVEATVAVPTDATLERVEVYRNDQLVARLTEPPYRATVEGEAAPTDFVRVVAYLAGGTSAEDVRFLAGDVAGERVEVNLVELFTVVTGEDGQPAEGLVAEDFEIEVNGRKRPVERFQLADDVPLTLALAVDTSESMWPLMPDARQAAGRFLIDTLIPGDRALLVAFSDRPRLIAPPSGDPPSLLRSFARLQAGGATALYDSIVFSLVQLEEAADRNDGRRAVVLLTDGQDYGSRFRPRRVIDDARAQGTPVYVVSIAGLYNERGGVRKPDVEAITGHTGGRTYYIDDVANLGSAYDQINRELRTQYILAFATEKPLTEKELRSVRVRVKRSGLAARVAIEPGR